MWKQTEYPLLYTRAITLIVRFFAFYDEWQQADDYQLLPTIFNYEYANNVRFLQVLTAQNTI